MAIHKGTTTNHRRENIMALTRIKVALYIIAAVLALIGMPSLLILIFLGLIETDITTPFMWATSIGSCVISVLCFSMARILVMWAEEDDELNDE